MAELAATRNSEHVSLVVAGASFEVVSLRGGHRLSRLFSHQLMCRTGADGLDAYRILEQQAKEVLRPGGRIVLEIGALAARDLFADWNEIEIQNDLSGRPCLLTALLPQDPSFARQK